MAVIREFLKLFLCSELFRLSLDLALSVCLSLVCFDNCVSHLGNDQFYSTDSIIVTRDYVIQFFWITVCIADSDKRNSKCMSFLYADLFFLRIYYEDSIWKSLHLFDTAKVLLQLV